MAVYEPMSPLGPREFRLLTLEPEEQDNGSVRVTLTKHPIDRAPNYDAISYAWGDVTQTTQIASNVGPREVTKNLLDVLVLLRTKFGRQVIWIDALCINQGDSCEKSLQIPQMPQIFAQADKVHMMLGNDDENTKEAFQAIHMFSDCTFVELCPEDTHRHIEALGRLLSRPYFKRSWIVQEIAVAQAADIHCGHLKTSFDRFVEAVRWIATKSYDKNIEYPLSTVLAIAEYRVFKRHDTLRWPRLVDTVAVFGGQAASDPRDKVYAFLGLARPGDVRSIVVDYEKSITDVYTGLARQAISSHSDLKILSHVYTRSDHDGLPSWVPDWSQPSFLSLGASADKCYRAAGGTTVIQGETLDRGILVLRGLRLDLIAEKGQFSRTLQRRRRTYRDIGFREFSDLVSSKFCRYVAMHFGSLYERTRENYEEVYLRTLTADTSGFTHRIPEHDKISRFPEYWNWVHREHPRPSQRVLSTYFQLTSDGGVPGVGMRRLPSAVFKEFFRRLSDVLWGRDLFVTEKDYLGLGPEHLQPGDVICVLLGGFTPFVLRQRKPRKPRKPAEFQLIGECYVHGFMDGEALKGVSDMSFEDFITR